VTFALLHCPGSVLATISLEQKILGGCVSLTMTRKLQLAVLLALSVAVQVTVWVPLAKVEPLGGMQLTVTLGQLSVALAL
jgi:hypothetical protein